MLDPAWVNFRLECSPYSRRPHQAVMWRSGREMTRWYRWLVAPEDLTFNSRPLPFSHLVGIVFHRESQKILPKCVNCQRHVAMGTKQQSPDPVGGAECERPSDAALPGLGSEDSWETSAKRVRQTRGYRCLSCGCGSSFLSILRC